MDRLQLKYLVIVLDRKAFLSISENNSTYCFKWFGSVSDAPSTYRSPAFNVISLIKQQAVYAALLAGYDVWFLDTDVVLLRDPILYFKDSRIDYFHSLNLNCPM